MASTEECQNWHCLICNVAVNMDGSSGWDIFQKDSLHMRLSAILEVQLTLLEGSHLQHICLDCERHVVIIESYRKILGQFRKNFAHTCSYHGIQLKPVLEEHCDQIDKQPAKNLAEGQPSGSNMVASQGQIQVPHYQDVQCQMKAPDDHVQPSHPFTFTVVNYGMSVHGEPSEIQSAQDEAIVESGAIDISNQLESEVAHEVQSEPTSMANLQLLQNSTISLPLDTADGQQLEEILLCLNTGQAVEPPVPSVTSPSGVTNLVSSDSTTYLTHMPQGSVSATDPVLQQSIQALADATLLEVSQESSPTKTMNSPRGGSHPETLALSRRFTCQLCSKAFRSRTHLKQHQRTHTGDRPFKCEDCSATFTVRSNLNRHLLKHSGERPYACEVCHLTYTQPAHLQRHMRVHNGIRPYQCTKCPRSFMWQHEFQEHLRFHSGERPYICAICNNDFARRRCYKEHLKIHASERPFKCDDCPATFVRKGDFVVHYRKHTGEKPYSCDSCQKKFAKASWLVTHKQNHHGTMLLECQICSLKFSKSTRLKSHMRTHGKKCKLTCQHCDISFRKAERFQAHMKKKHKEVMAETVQEEDEADRQEEVIVEITSPTVEAGGDSEGDSGDCNETLTTDKLP